MAAFEILRCCGCLAILSSFGHELIDYCLRGGAREQVSALGLVDRPLYVFETNLRPAAREFAYVELLERDSGIFQKRYRGTLEGVVLFDHPQHSDGEKEFSLPLDFVVLPEIEGARGEFRVGLIGAVRAADDPCFASG